MAEDRVDYVTKFFTAYQNKTTAELAECLADNYEFSDPAFPSLKGKHGLAMFAMFIAGADTNKMKMTFTDVQINGNKASVKYTPDYIFDGRPVVNHITADITLDDNGKILKHVDFFDFHAWASQSLGFVGTLFGGFSFLQNKVQARANEKLTRFIEKNPEYQ